MGSSSHDFGAEIRMHYFTVYCDTNCNNNNNNNGYYSPFIKKTKKKQQWCEHRIRKNKQIKSTVHDANKKMK